MEILIRARRSTPVIEGKVAFFWQFCLGQKKIKLFEVFTSHTQTNARTNAEICLMGHSLCLWPILEG